MEDFNEIIAPHKDAIFFWKACGSWPGGDPVEIFNAAKALGMPEHEVKLGCSGCFANALNLIFDHLDKKEYLLYKQQKGI